MTSKLFYAVYGTHSKVQIHVINVRIIILSKLMAWIAYYMRRSSSIRQSQVVLYWNN